MWRTAGCAVVLLAVAVLGSTILGGRRSAQAETDTEVARLGRHIATLLSAGDTKAVADLFVATDVTCPAGNIGGTFTPCIGVPDGETAEGYRSGIFGSDAFFDTREELVDRLDIFLEHFFSGAEFEVATIAPSGWPSAWTACAACSAVVLTTPNDRPEGCVEGERRLCPTAAQFNLLATPVGLRVHSVGVGGIDSERQAMFDGGVVADLSGSGVDVTYTVVEPLAPQVGTGLAELTIAEPQQEELVAFGRQVASLLANQRFDAVAGLFVPTEIECPLRFSGQVIEACVGVADGATALAYPGAVFGSDAGYATLQGVRETLAQLDVLQFGSFEFRLYSVAHTGLPSPFEECLECSAVVLSVPGEINRDTSGAISTSGVLYLELRSTPDGLRISKWVLGGGNPEMITGGTVDGQTFIAVEPLAPQLGAGLGPHDGQDAITGATTGVGVVLLVVGLAIVAGVLGRGATASRRLRGTRPLPRARCLSRSLALAVLVRL